MAIFKCLQSGEQGAQNDGDAEASHEILAIAMLQCMVRPGDCATRQQQYQRVNQRQIKWIKCGDAFRRPYTPFREQGTIKKRPEEGDKEHHLRGDEQHHAITHADLNDGRVMALILGFANDIAPPHIHGHQHQHKTKSQHSHAVLNLVHIHHTANRSRKCSCRSNGWPRACLYKVIWVFIGTAHFRLLTIWPVMMPATSPRLRLC